MFAISVWHINQTFVVCIRRWKPVLQSWLDKLPAGLTDAHKTLLLSLFDWLIPPCLRIATKLVKPVLQIVDINLVCSCMRLLESHLDLFK
jgi:dynein heavy chain